MSGVAPSPYHQDIQNDIGALNPASTPLLPHPTDISTGFLPPAALPPTTLQPQMLQEPPATFVAMTDVPASTSTATNTMVVAMPDVSPPVYMTPMENIVPRSHARAPPPGFLTDLSACNQFPMVSVVENSMRLDVSPSNHSLTISPSQSQVSSPSAHGSSSSYSVGVTSSLESALEQSGLSLLQSHANTSVSPVAVPSSFIPLPSPSQPAIIPAFSTSEAAVTKTEEILTEPEPHIILGDMLEDIVKTASSARDACKMRHGAEASSKLDELKERISQVSQMFAGLMAGLSLSDRTFTAPYATPMQSPPALTEPQTINFPPVPVAANIAASPMELTDVSGLSDQSRKRCASEFVEHRTVKAPKREAQDDDPLSLPVAEPPSAVDPTFAIPSIPSLSMAASMPMPIPPSSQPSSRPPTPNSFNARTPFSPTKPSSGLSMFPPFLPGGSASMDFASSIPTPLTSAPAQVFPPVQGWPEPVIQQRHHHSLSTGSLTTILPTVAPISPGITENFTAPPVGQVAVPSATPAAIATSVTSPIGRMSRSGSISGAFPTSYNFTYKESLSDTAGSWSGRIQPQTPSSQTTSPWFGGNDKATSSGSPIPTEKTTANITFASSRKLPFAQEDEDEDDGDSDENDGNMTKATQPSSSDAPSSSGNGINPSPSSDVPAEYRVEVDRIFFEYLNKICSNLDATDSKGEPIHQTLMAKKMQRLDESPDFRPFKFRIQAFTLAFLEELARQGYPEEKIPMKKIRNYLWRQQYILRFNEDGKKAKSKGNHIWNIEAKKAGDGRWEFRPFHRKLAGSPPSVAYCGLKWSWTPRVWDPQASWQNVPVEYSSPNLPSWLSWKDDILSGIPPPDAESCTVTVNAKYVLDGQEGHLSHTFHLTIAPMNSVDTTTFSRSRRPSLAGDPPKRSTSDSALFQAVQRTKPRTSPSVGDPESPNHRVIRVLQNVAQRVTEETESQLVLASPPRTNFQDLVKQKHVIEQTVEAYDKAISGQTPPQGRRLAVAAQNVVVQAAHSVIADRTVAGGGIPVPQSETTAIKSVTVSELTDATQDAIAEAVKREGTESSEVDIIVAATSILKSRTPGSPSTADPPPVLGQQARSHSTGTVPRLMTASNYPPPALPPLTEYV